MVAHLRQFAALIAMALWSGGLTCYSLFVVPIGAAVVGATDQGMIT